MEVFSFYLLYVACLKGTKYQPMAIWWNSWRVKPHPLITLCDCYHDPGFNHILLIKNKNNKKKQTDYENPVVLFLATTPLK